MPRDSMTSSQHAARSAARRTRELARIALLAYFALAAAGCSYPRSANGPALVSYAAFRQQLGRLVEAHNRAGATEFLNSTDPVALARAASAQSDIRYMVVTGTGAGMPGIPPRPAPARTWNLPSSADFDKNPGEPEDKLFQRAAYQFAQVFNKTLAIEEKGVR